MPRSEAFCPDCLTAVRKMPDNAFDLAVADPPYGVKYARGKNGFGVCDNRPEAEELRWDVAPAKEVFDELRRVSRRQIVWGGNYFTDMLPASKCWIVWDKYCDTVNKGVFSDCELAWTSMTGVCKMFKFRQIGFISDTQFKERIHPTQKPPELYSWIYREYANPGETVLDPFLGSGSSRIAAWDAGWESRERDGERLCVCNDCLFEEKGYDNEQRKMENQC